MIDNLTMETETSFVFPPALTGLWLIFDRTFD
jgi:hypothetical protein